MFFTTKAKNIHENTNKRHWAQFLVDVQKVVLVKLYLTHFEGTEQKVSGEDLSKGLAGIPVKIIFPSQEVISNSSNLVGVLREALAYAMTRNHNSNSETLDNEILPLIRIHRLPTPQEPVHGFIEHTNFNIFYIIGHFFTIVFILKKDSSFSETYIRHLKTVLKQLEEEYFGIMTTYIEGDDMFLLDDASFKQMFQQISFEGLWYPLFLYLRRKVTFNCTDSVCIYRILGGTPGFLIHEKAEKTAKYDLCFPLPVLFEVDTSHYSILALAHEIIVQLELTKCLKFCHNSEVA